ncbi:hypothetical protein TRVA0_050S00342 [Trichomonascus vanleenenianus]|uniref:uncharacterized protein n=1 Tax=Trichomonascus vanleenenianus TaxID=2268995 RepID=UPI003EC96712
MNQILTCVFLLISALVVQGASINEKQAIPLPPTEDPFYKPPQGYEDEPLGTILRYRQMPVPPGILNMRVSVQEAYQLLYRTSDTFGKPEATVTTVLVPNNADFNKLLSYQIPVDAAYVNCAASYSLQMGSNINAFTSQAELALIEYCLDLGWIVNAPDFDGPKAALTAATQSGQATLDSIRAVLNYSKNITGVEKNAKVALWGYSDGALATGWATQLAPSYYPELEIIGSALGGTVADLIATGLALNDGPYSGMVFSGIAGISQEYPEYQDLINMYGIPELMAKFNTVREMCQIQAVYNFEYNNLFDYVTIGKEILLDPNMTEILSQQNLGNHTPTAPLYMYHGVKDEMAPFSAAEALYDKWCGEGVDIEFQISETTEHIEECILGAANAVSWLQDRMDGKPVEKGCRIQLSSSSVLDYSALQTFGNQIYNQLNNFLSALVK